MDFSRILGLTSTETEIPLSEKLSTSNDMTENGSKNVIDETLCVKDSCGNLRFVQAENDEDLKNPSK